MEQGGAHRVLSFTIELFIADRFLVRRISIFSCVYTAEPTRFQRIAPNLRAYRHFWLNLVPYITKQIVTNKRERFYGKDGGSREWERSQNERNQCAFCTYIKLSKINVIIEKLYYLSELTGRTKTAYNTYHL